MSTLGLGLEKCALVVSFYIQTLKIVPAIRCSALETLVDTCSIKEANFYLCIVPKFGSFFLFFSDIR